MHGPHAWKPVVLHTRFLGAFFFLAATFMEALSSGLAPKEYYITGGVYSSRGIPKGEFGPHKVCTLNRLSHKIMSEIIEVPVQGESEKQSIIHVVNTGSLVT